MTGSCHDARRRIVERSGSVGADPNPQAAPAHRAVPSDPGRGDRRQPGRPSSATPTWSTSPTARCGPASRESVRGADVFIIQSHGRTPGRSVNDSLMEQWIMIDAAKRASAKRITAVCPYYGYSRQDRKSKGREPITARMVSDFFATAGADRIISVDLHSGPDPGFLRRPGRPPDRRPAPDRLPARARPERRLRDGGPRHRPDQGGRAGRPPRRRRRWTWPRSTSAGPRTRSTRSRPST